MRYKTKTSEVEAWQWNSQSLEHPVVPGWINEMRLHGRIWISDYKDGRTMTIVTPQGEQKIKPGDYIVRDRYEHLNIYPPEVFQLYYEAA